MQGWLENLNTRRGDLGGIRARMASTTPLDVAGRLDSRGRRMCQSSVRWQHYIYSPASG
jgi:hypothetical protein